MLLITGGAGYIGSHTAVAAIRAGYKVIIADNFGNASPEISNRLSKNFPDRLICARGDLTNQEWVQNLFLSHKIRSVIHFAALKAAGESLQIPLDYYGNNLTSLVNVMRSAAANSVRNFVFSSSAAVYGLPEKCPVDETMIITTGNTPYGFTKLIGERMLADFHRAGSRLHMTALRYFNPVGALEEGWLGESPAGTPTNLVPLLLEAATGKRDEIIVYGNDYPTSDGSCMRDYIHVMDIAEAHLAALQWLESQAAPAPPEVFNLGTGQGSSTLEVLQLFEKVSGMRLKWKFGPRRGGDLPEIWANASKAQKTFGWKTRRTLEQALADAWRWAQNPENSSI